MSRIIYILIVLIICLPSAGSSQSQLEAGNAKLKAQFIYSFTKYIGWKNQEYLSGFSISVLATDSIMFKALSKRVQKKNFNGKPIYMKLFSDIDQISKVQILYVNQQHGYDINEIVKKVKGKRTLLITENYPFQSSMINFVQVKTQMKYEINEQRLKEEKFTVLDELLADAITSPGDWQNIFRQTEGELVQERLKVEKQKAEISKIQSEIQAQRKAIDQANAELTLKQQEIEKQQNHLGKLKLISKTKQLELDQKTTVLAQQDEAILSQKRKLESQNLDLMMKKELVQEKLKEVEDHQKKIKTQKKHLNQLFSEKEQEKLIRFMLIAFVGLLVAFVFLVWRALAQKKKANLELADKNKAIEMQKAEIEMQKEKSEQLLLNILPSTTAEELKKNGKATARHYQITTVMFTDFKGFTKIAERLTAVDLVKELDGCFSAFDQIIEEYHVEKIKTIGDAYMCAGGVPIRNRSNPVFVTLAALAIRDYMDKIKKQQEAKNQPVWQLRIGLHTGPITAGVVGKKKFAYDVWGDTVNTAARMESSGEPGQVNISQFTHQFIKEYFDCTHRGKVEAKGKGEMDMYFVNRINEKYSQNGTGVKPNQKFLKLLASM